MTNPAARFASFRYLGYAVDEDHRQLVCRYGLDGRTFEERISVAGTGPWAGPAVDEAARLVFLLAGVSYYKAGAPPVVDLGDTPVRAGERDFLRSFYVDGLGEFAYRNGIRVDPDVVGGSAAGPPVAMPGRVGDRRPLVPFGGGLDSIVTVELLRDRTPDLSLFVVSRAGDRFAAIEGAAAAVRLPVLRAERAIDQEILRSTANGFLNGHVPVTGILSAIAVLAAVLEGHDAVVMSNEWSASVGNVTVDGRTINHQFSKGAAFETGLRSVLSGAFESPPDYFSLLRPYSELWIARRFADLGRYHRVFRSCNRAFHIDPAQRLATWCGTCDKCCFIDLVLAPFLAADELVAIFGGREPLADLDLIDRFRTLLGLSADLKPFECVGDVGECRAAAVLAADRSDRADRRGGVLAPLVAELGADGVAEARRATEALLRPMGPANAPESYAPSRLLV